MNEPITVVMVDDHLFIRRGVRAILEEPGEPAVQILGEASSADAALDLVEQYAPRVLLADLKLGASFEPGLALIQQVRRTSPLTEVLVITAYDEEGDHILRAIHAGASGCISKGDELNGAELRAGIAEVARGRRFSSPKVLQRLYTLIQTGGGGLPLYRESLTKREREVLALIADGLSNQEIADRLLVALTTVKSHVSNILAKLQVPSRELAVLSFHASTSQDPHA